MSLNESIVEDAALEWLGELGYAVGHGPHLAPGEPAAERDSFSEVVLVGRLREAIHNPRHSIDRARVVLVGRLREAIRRLNLSIWDLASGETWRKCQGTTKIKLISIRLPITKKLLTFDSLVVDEH